MNRLAAVLGLDAVHVVDVGGNPIDGQPPYAELLKAGLVRLVGFEPQPDARARRAAAAGPHERYLPHAVGDGRRVRFRTCRATGMSSTLPPNRATRRLDDPDEIQDMDLLKTDEQCGELPAFQDAQWRLADAVLVQTEVNFLPMYEGQPLFAELDLSPRRGPLRVGQWLPLARRPAPGSACPSLLATPESAPEVKVGLEVALGKGALAEGDVVEATARVTNLTDEQLPTVVAIVGVPGGLEPRIDQLKELVKAKAIDAYEVMGRDVVLYWRGMTPKEQRRVPVSLVAAVPGAYVGPASRAYLYYGDEHKAWVAGLSADIAAK